MTEKSSNPQKDKYFFDVHSHAFTISHAGVLSYINHFLTTKNYTFSDIINEDPFNIIYHLLGNDSGDQKEFNVKAFVNKYIIYIVIAISVLAASAVALWQINSWLVLIPAGILIALAIIVSLIISKKTTKVQKAYANNIKPPINLLSIMENDIGSALLRMEWDVLALDHSLKSVKLNGKPILKLVQESKLSKAELIQVKELWHAYLEQNGGFKIGDKVERIKKYVLTPLIVDFGYKDYDIEGIHYKKPPSKPVVVQVIDTFAGIQSYLNRSPFKIFEIFPFMGINPKHYQLKIGDEGEHDNSIKTMFEKYFNGLKKEDNPEKRFRDFKQKMPKYNDDLDCSTEEIFMQNRLSAYLANKNQKQHTAKEIEDIILYLKQSLDEIKIDQELEDTKHFYNHFFVGIKLYPPLGFDPWPDDEHSAERKKVDFMYQQCIEHNLPIVTHCNFGGFTVDTNANIEKFTNPVRWEAILKKYPGLKVDFAHIGGDHEGDVAAAKKWRDKIFDYIIEYERIYTDFSCMCFNNNDYETLHQQIEDYLKARPGSENIEQHRQKIYSRILYGTDFSINLLFGANSYEEYLNNFILSTPFSEDVKKLFSEENPRSFLFGN